MTDTGIADLVKRLRELAPYVEEQSPVLYEQAAATAMLEAADALEAAERRLATLEEAYIKASERQKDFEGTQTILQAAIRGATGERKGGDDE